MHKVWSHVAGSRLVQVAAKGHGAMGVRVAWTVACSGRDRKAYNCRVLFGKAWATNLSQASTRFCFGRAAGSGGRQSAEDGRAGKAERCLRGTRFRQICVRQEFDVPLQTYANNNLIVV